MNNEPQTSDQNKLPSGCFTASIVWAVVATVVCITLSQIIVFTETFSEKSVDGTPRSTHHVQTLRARHPLQVAAATAAISLLPISFVLAGRGRRQNDVR